DAGAPRMDPVAARVECGAPAWGLRRDGDRAGPARPRDPRSLRLERSPRSTRGVHGDRRRARAALRRGALRAAGAAALALDLRRGVRARPDAVRAGVVRGCRDRAAARGGTCRGCTPRLDADATLSPVAARSDRGP